MVAAIQMVSDYDVDANLKECSRLISLAKKQGAELIVLPESFPIIGLKDTDKVKLREKFNDGPIQTFLRNQAITHKIWLVGGTIPLFCDDPSKILAACLLYNPSGDIVARYDKMHLFDIDISKTGERYRESATIIPGDKLVVAKTPFGNVGLAVCYDVRFPEFFRELINHQVEIIVLPSAFTNTTGKAHWECLVRARAIENTCYVIAANQGGQHSSGYNTYGNSMIVDPWGDIMNQMDKGIGVVTATIDLEKMKEVRSAFPCLQHRILK